MGPHSDISAAFHADADDLELYVRGRFEPSRTGVMESHLVRCEDCRKRLSETLGVRQWDVLLSPSQGVGSDKRGEPRFGTSNPVTLQELNPLSIERIKAQVLNVSASGLGALVQRYVAPGTIVQIRIGGEVVLALTRSCIQRSTGDYRVGLRFQQEF